MDKRPKHPAMLTLLAIILLFCQGCAHTPKLTPGKFPEEHVRVQAKDGISNGRVIYAPAKNAPKPIAIVWIHGWGTNFYAPTYVNVGRALAERGYTCIAGNTRMHDLGNIEWIGDKRIRGVIAKWADTLQPSGKDAVPDKRQAS